MTRFEVRVAALVRLATGVVFLAEGYGKVTGDFVRGGFARSASEMAPQAWPFWGAFLRRAVLPNARTFAWVVALGELVAQRNLADSVRPPVVARHEVERAHEAVESSGQ